MRMLTQEHYDMMHGDYKLTIRGKPWALLLDLTGATMLVPILLLDRETP